MLSHFVGHRLRTPDPWAAVRNRFAATGIDPAIFATAGDKDVATGLLAATPPDGWPPAPGGVDRVVDVGFGVNLPLTSAVIAPNGVIATYGSDAVPVPEFPFYPLMRKGVTVRTVSVFIMPPDAMRAAVSEIGALLAQGALTHRIAVQYPLGAIAAAHQYVESGLGIGKTVLTIQAL